MKNILFLRLSGAFKGHFFKKATKIDEIFTVDLTLCSKHQIDGEDFSNFVTFLENMNFDLLRWIPGSPKSPQLWAPHLICIFV